MRADEEVAMLLSAWEDERSQEQLDGMPIRMQKGPCVAFHVGACPLTIDVTKILNAKTFTVFLFVWQCII